MKLRLVAFCAWITLMGWSAWAGQNRDGEKRDAKPFDYKEIEKAPVKARAKRNPFESNAQAVAAGKTLFEQHCAECHGEAALGGKKAPSLRVPEIQDAEPGAIFWIVTNGVVRRGMPVWSKLPEPQRWQLVTYIKSLGVASDERRDQVPPQ
jgi:mono/diheme cytochrome c family protein